MVDFSTFGAKDDPNNIMGKQRPTTLQIELSVALGVFAFFTFCVLRPRWSGLYAARKKSKDASSSLPELPNSLLGWMLPLWRITEQQVLASAGLDAYVFLRFFKLAIKFLSITLFFSLVVIKPVHDSYPDDDEKQKNSTLPFVPDYDFDYELRKRSDSWMPLNHSAPWMPEVETDYLWMYPVFAYVFTALALYLITSETRNIIEVRQEYLGSQTTITDRTIRLSGIPPELQSEEKIKDFIQELGIGNVESVLLCRQWAELDQHIVKRNDYLRRLEEAYTVYQGQRSIERNLEALPIAQPVPPGPSVDPEDDEHDDEEHRRLLRSGDSMPAQTPYARVRPKAKIYFGRFNLRSRQVDAIDYYEEKLRVIDAEIRDLRNKDFEPVPLAFVTMDTVAASQMACQAVLDPSPLQLLANPSPAPADIVWTNTYLSRRSRMFRSWSITAFILLLTIFWSVTFVPIATFLNTDTIREFFPSFAELLDSHPLVQSLVTNQLPTIAVTLLNAIVPYLYDWLSNCQGMTSQGDVELSVISKNFFFTFFNFFIVFTILGTASNFYDKYKDIGKNLRDTTRFAWTLASSLQRLLAFYTNFIILQGLGLFPFRLLEFGTMALYPIGLMGAKTPRDYAELIQPPRFSYGLYLPQTLLIFIICVVYSVLRDSWKVILSGLVYFVIGSFVYKYQLLYAMDHRQHSTGKSWVMICDRVQIGIILFQITVGGQLALKKALLRSVMLVPLVVGSVWFFYVYGRTYKPLMEFIALKSVRRAEHADYESAELQGSDSDDHHRYEREANHGQTVDESRERGMRFVNPSLISPLEKVWIADIITHNSNRATQNPPGDEIA
ncbi:DUF221-domain-containing protein [Aureobasidium pullulans]|nr:DUF221-domain-containing protein [Aureobasidium pullulans]THY66018.1 DUF221-domain-containing protein [Aureobasidium pullulans]TIA85720.1 DUF221-domain-containing protein [Aureobasidium pullulans]